MRRMLLLPGLMALALITVGCGDGDQPDPETAAPAENAVTENANTENADQAEAKPDTQEEPKESEPVEETASTDTQTPAETTPPAEEKPAETDTPKTVAKTTEKPAAKVGVDASYILEEAVAALVIHPQQLLAAPALAGNPLIAMQLEQAQTMSGVNIGNVEQIIISGGPGATPDEKPFSVVVRFADPHAGVEMVENLARMSEEQGEVEEVAFEGAVYYRQQKDEAEGDAAAEDAPDGFGVQPPKPAMPNAVYLPDDKTVVLGDEVWIKKLIQAEGVAATPLTAALAEVESSSDILFVLSMTDKLRELAAAAKSLNPTPTPFDELPNQLTKLVFNASISPEILVNANLTLVDDKAAGEIDVLINSGLEEGQTAMEMQVAELEGAAQNDPGVAMMLAPLQELQKILNGISTEQTGPVVRIEMGGLGQVNYQAIAQGAMMMFMSGMGGGAFGPPAGGPPQGFDSPADPTEEKEAEEAPAESDDEDN